MDQGIEVTRTIFNLEVLSKLKNVKFLLDYLLCVLFYVYMMLPWCDEENTLSWNPGNALL